MQGRVGNNNKYIYDDEDGSLNYLLIYRITGKTSKMMSQFYGEFQNKFRFDPFDSKPELQCKGYV